MATQTQNRANQCTANLDQPIRLLRLRSVIERVGLSKSSIYNRIREGAFPVPVSLGGSAIGFVDREIDGWISQAIDRRRAPELRPVNQGHYESQGPASGNPAALRGPDVGH
jgi:prophage regulatory protein